ncbi:hypothetical protein [Enterobacter hormaechei]|uniref:hypothetical protein n=1 Tax=Enterobacter hormaechei TaxID=158836 RepID=UPI0007E43FB6|nr:hypothetical protein [Enterobacter hormaechei]
MSVKRYEVNGSSSIFENENGSLVDYDDYAALEARCAALAAENALMKKSEPAPFSKLMMEALDVYQAGADEVPELAMLSAYKKLRDGLKTPATDAFLAEVRAQGVEMAMNRIHETGSWTFGDCYIALSGLVDEILRKGVQS